jgi:hypothetical protein
MNQDVKAAVKGGRMPPRVQPANNGMGAYNGGAQNGGGRACQMLIATSDVDRHVRC